MQRHKFLAISSLLLLSSCSLLNPAEVVVQTEYVERVIPIQARPKGITTYPINFFAVTEENFDDLLTKDIDRLAVGGVAAGGVTLATVIALWPYVIANYRGLITNDQLKSACMGICGDSGKELFKRVTLAIACGPIYAWWLLARMSMKLTDISTEEEKTTESFQDEEPKDTGPKKYTRRQLFMKFVPTMSTT